jgi:thymidylate synthase (FAD)
MRILYPKDETDWQRERNLITKAGHTAYRADDSRPGFIGRIVDAGHFAVLEFGNMVVEFTTDRGITHEIVRHRLCSFVQESTRYCNYNKGMEFIVPEGLNEDAYQVWLETVNAAEVQYLAMLGQGMKPQVARSVLPNSLAVQIVVKANFREWRHIFQLRAIEKAAHPDMRALMIPLYYMCRARCPDIFDLGEPQ